MSDSFSGGALDGAFIRGRDEGRREGRAENERLRDALAEIADDNNPSPSDPALAVKWFREIALKALKFTNECASSNPN